MNKQERIKEARDKVDQLYPEWEKINIKYNLKQIYIKTHPYLGRPIF